MNLNPLQFTLTKDSVPQDGEHALVLFRSEGGDPSLSSATYTQGKWKHVETGTNLQVFAWMTWITRQQMDTLFQEDDDIAMQNEEWTPVSLSLPRAGKHVLVYYRSGQEGSLRRGIGYQRERVWYDEFNEQIEVVEWRYWPRSETAEPSENISITPDTGKVFGEGY